MEVTLIIHSVDGAREVPLSGSRLTLGRTEPADLVINDQSLSRVHASINRDGDRVWIIDEGSTNGSLVNGAAVPASGTPLRDGDEIYRAATADLFRGAFEVQTVIILKDLYADLENTIDRCQHVGDSVERIMIKNM